jgi:AraC family transcriptional regulator, transcriptional activator of pobA
MVYYSPVVSLTQHNDKMNKRKTEILLHQDELKDTPVEMLSFKGLVKSRQHPHRDDHFMFIIQRNGYSLWELDFKEVVLKGPALCFVAPGQVHCYLNFKQSTGWLVFVKASLIPASFRDLFTAHLHVHQSASVPQNDVVFRILPVIEDVFEDRLRPFHSSLMSSSIETLSALFASHIVQRQKSASLIGGQKYQITIRFKQLVIEQSKALKQVKGYAAQLHITPLYLNEVVKEVTGFPASYWISQAILLEAERMLYYTQLDVKQIAYSLGYEDHAYFSRFFKKNTGMTAREFRNSKT